ncbi:MAG: FkbM family methyltransferase, partial [Rhodospirillaceae bacterium]|nr:FkbM family methyltransferase [Rhodospirillaceae bacterium]
MKLPALSFLRRAPAGLAEIASAGCDVCGEYENLIARIGERLLKPGAIAVDGGASRGRHTIAFAKRVAPGGRVHAIEPLPDMMARNAARAREEGVAGIVAYHDAALWHAAGEATFFRGLDNGEDHSSLRLRLPDKTYAPMPVRLATLDSLLPGERIDFLKLDLEGAEYDALQGARALLRRSDCFVVFEHGRGGHAQLFDYSPDDFFGLFRDTGFGLWDAFGRPFGPK